MDTTLLNSLLNTPNLLDYMNGGTGTATTQTGPPSLLNAINALNNEDTTDGSDSIDLSSLSQILAQANNQTSASSTTGTGTTGVQAAANTMLTGFFPNNGVDTTKLSTTAQALIQGFQDIITNSGTTGRDSTTDALQEKDNSNLQVYTLTGPNRRLSISINSSGASPTMTVTDVNGGQVETATMSIGTDSTGTTPAINITRTERQYSNGLLQSATTPDSLSIDLYATS